MDKALLVGINKYRNGNNLNGCVNDVVDMWNVMMSYGYMPENVRVLCDERATKAAIMERLKWLVKDATSGDRLLFHFSGHGSQIRDRNGDELSDFMDEIICPHDMDWNGTYITDDDLAQTFAGIPEGVNLEVILDSCHSGTGTRDFKQLQRFMPPPFDIAVRRKGQCKAKRGLFDFLSPKPMNHVLWAGCKSSQTSADAMIDGQYHGAFTHYFCIALERDVDRKATLESARKMMRMGGFDQTPQLECNDNKLGKLFLS